jgi:ferredoxin
MRASIDKSGCISCGLCVETCPSVFRIGEDGYAEVFVDIIPAEEAEATLQAQDNCPVSVITTEE